MANDGKRDIFSEGPMQAEELLDGIFHVKFRSQRHMASTLLRFQEYFESVKFKGKIFTLKEFADWYASVKGKFDYYEAWNGFNLPSESLKPFYEGKFDPLSDEEKAFLDIFKNRKGIFYIICTLEGGSLDELRHEFCHALFYTNREYRKQVADVLEECDTRDIAQHLASDLLYHPDVILDEVHAYLLSDLDYLEEEGFDAPQYHEIHRKLNEIFGRYFVMPHFGKGR